LGGKNETRPGRAGGSGRIRKGPVAARIIADSRPLQGQLGDLLVMEGTAQAGGLLAHALPEMVQIAVVWPGQLQAVEGGGQTMAAAAGCHQQCSLVAHQFRGIGLVGGRIGQEGVLMDAGLAAENG
jgi:hypothetical protein